MACGPYLDLRDDVEDLVGAGPDEDLGRIDTVACCRGLDQTPIVGRWVFGQRCLEPARRQEARDERGRGGGGVEIEPDDRRWVEAVPRGDLLVGRLPAIRRRRGRRREGDRRRAHRSGSAKRISTASR